MTCRDNVDLFIDLVCVCVFAQDLAHWPHIKIDKSRDLEARWHGCNHPSNYEIIRMKCVISNERWQVKNGSCQCRWSIVLHMFLVYTILSEIYLFSKTESFFLFIPNMNWLQSHRSRYYFLLGAHCPHMSDVIQIHSIKYAPTHTSAHPAISSSFYSSSNVAETSCNLSYLYQCSIIMIILCTAALSIFPLFGFLFAKTIINLPQSKQYIL